jgi:hypothetical protein
MIPSSITRFVEATSKAVAIVKSAPLRKIERAKATGASEHEDELAPRAVANSSPRGDESGSSRVISAFETTAWTTAESREAEDQRPGDLQGDPQGEEQRADECVNERHTPTSGSSIFFSHGSPASVFLGTLKTSQHAFDKP